MRLSEFKPTDVLKSILTEEGVKQTIYIGSKPTAGLPTEFIGLYQNGRVSTSFSKYGLVKGFILVSVSVKLKSNGERNDVRERIILSAFDHLFEDGKAVEKDGYVFMLEPDNMVYNGGGVYEGYSSKLINITFKKL